MAKGWGIPNAYVKNALTLLKQYDGWWVEFDAKRDGYTIKRADQDELKEYQRRLSQRLDVMKPRFNLAETRLLGLRQQRAASAIAFGGKSANLGEVMNARLPGIVVPNGFTIPFFYYDEFLRANNLDDAIYTLLNDQKFVHDPAYRREKLVKLRESIKQAQFDDKLQAQILRRVKLEFAGKGLFVRSSSNSEDLPNFSGAGLYTTVPNVRGDKHNQAIKPSGTLWNFEAAARERSSIDHRIFGAVLIQEGSIPAPGNDYHRSIRQRQQGRIYIAKRGLGIKVVEGEGCGADFRERANAAATFG